MKKFVSLLLAVLMLATMLTVFAVPAFAANIEGTKSYDRLEFKEPVTIESGANVTAKRILLNSGGSLVVKSGATVNVEHLEMYFDTSMTIESGATVNIQEGDHQQKNLSVAGTLTIAGELLGNNIEGSLLTGSGKIILQPGGLFDVTFFDGCFSNSLYNAVSSTDCTVARKGNRLIAETEHKYGENGVCIRCDHVCDNSFHNGVCPECHAVASTGLNVGSALSEGNLTIIVGVACLVVGFLAAMFIFKKKKPALASGENKDEE